MKKRMMTLWLLLLTGGALFAGRVDTVRVYSPAMDKTVPVLLVFPEQNENTDSLNVVFLLHGYGGSFKSWQKQFDLRPLADRYGVLIVCPDGSPNSWYLDSPLQRESQYETFTARELPRYILKNHPARKAAAHWAVTGLSMGGHGALYLAIRHPERFGQMASMSGGVDLTYSTKRWEIALKLGDYGHNRQRWHENSVVNMVGQIREPYRPMLIDCGVDDIFIDNNRALHKRLLQAAIPHDYYERPGGHSWDYWTRVLPYHLFFFNEHWPR